MCVKECPTEYGPDADDLKCKMPESDEECDITPTYPSIISYSYCLPTDEFLKDVGGAFLDAMNKQNNFASYAAEIADAGIGLLYMALATFVISFIYIMLLRWITKPLLYVSLFVILLCFIGLGVFGWMKKEEYKEAEDEAYTKKNEETGKDKSEWPPIEYSDNYNYSMYGAIAAWVIGACYGLCVCCCWNNIALGASIMEAASEFVTKNIIIIFLPMIAYLISLVVLGAWTVGAIHLYSIGEPEF